MVGMLLSTAVGAALGCGGDGALGGGVALGAVVRLSSSVWPLAVLFAVVGPLVLNGVMTAVVAGGDKIVFQEETNFMPMYLPEGLEEFQKT